MSANQKLSLTIILKLKVNRIYLHRNAQLWSVANVAVVHAGEPRQSPRYCRDSVMDIRRLPAKPGGGGLSIRRAASRTRGRVAPLPLPPSGLEVRGVDTRDTQG